MYKRIALEVQYECRIPPFYLYHPHSSCVNCQNPFKVRSTIKTPKGFALTYISPYSFKIVALLLSAPLLTPSELLRLTLRWLTRATPSSAACVYFWHPPTSYLSTFPLSAHNLSRTRFRARTARQRIGGAATAIQHALTEHTCDPSTLA